MAEETQQSQDDVTELATLRQAHTEVLAKRQKDKAKIAELEAANTELTANLTEATSSLRAVTIEGPLKTMAESISTAPELFIEQFSKQYRLELVKGQLTLLSTDGKPVFQKDGKSVPFERDVLVKFLTAGDDASAKAFQAIAIGSRASGASANATQGRGRSPAPKTLGIQFGLR